MAEIWTTPITWALDDVFEASVANVQIRDNLNYLLKRPIDGVTTNYASLQNLDATTWTQLSTFDVSITTKTGRIEYFVNIPLQLSVEVYFDVYCPELNIWLSSGTSTQLTNGAWAMQSSNIGYDMTLSTSIYRDLGSLGTFTFELYYKATAASQVDIKPNEVVSVRVKEV